MSQAEALLNQAARSGVYTASPETEPHIVIGADRVIVVPDELKRLAVQFDHNIETVVFDCPRYWDDTDMSTMAVYINYERRDGVRGNFFATNVVVDESDETMMHFEWTISKFVTLVEGTVKFNVCVKSVDDEGNELEHWNSELCEDCYISEGLETNAVIENAYPDAITQLRTKMDNILNSGMAVDVTMQKVDDELIVSIVAPEGSEEFRIKDGKTPFIGTNGNWWIGDTDTGVAAAASTEGFMPATVYDPQGKKTDIFKYVEDNGVSEIDRAKWDGKSDFSGSYNDLTNKPTLFSGKYGDLTEKPWIPSVVNIHTSTSTSDAASANTVREIGSTIRYTVNSGFSTGMYNVSSVNGQVYHVPVGMLTFVQFSLNFTTSAGGSEYLSTSYATDASTGNPTQDGRVIITARIVDSTLHVKEAFANVNTYDNKISIVIELDQEMSSAISNKRVEGSFFYFNDRV